MRVVDGERRVRLEGEADRLRRRLADTLAAIDRRRHELFNPRQQAAAHKVLAASAGGTLAVALGASVAWGLHRRRTRTQRRRRERWRALGRLWEHPERVAVHSEGSVLSEAGRRIAVGALTFVMLELLRRTTRRALGSRDR
jgi:hypothetical protein